MTPLLFYLFINKINRGNSNNKSNQSEEYTYMTADKEHNQTYMFSYDNSDKSVLDMYVNSSFIDENESREVINASIPHFIIDGAPTYGFSSILSKIGLAANVDWQIRNNANIRIICFILNTP